MQPCVDVNMMVYNCIDTVGAAIDSVLAQTWPNLTLTLFDNASTDGTIAVLEEYAARYPSVRIHRNRCNAGPIANIQRAFWFGHADFVMPKTSDDLIAPDYVERLISVLLAHPDTAMCHAGGEVFTAAGQVIHTYPREHWLHAIGSDAVERARQVMWHYTSAPSFWGVYRRSMVDQLSTIRYRPGFDHAVVAELALYGEIRHVPEVLYRRRGSGKPVMLIGRGATEAGNRGVPLDDALAEQRWRTPLLTTAHTHFEVFAISRLPEAQRSALMRSVPTIFRARWLPLFKREAADLRAALPGLLECIATAEPMIGAWLTHSVAEILLAAQTMLPEAGFSEDLLSLAALSGELAPNSSWSY
jgi:hypothetical protein